MEDGTADLEQRLAEASSLADEDRLPEAFEMLLEEEAEHPRDPTLLCMLGFVAGEMEETSGLAYDYYRRCLQEEPLDPPVLITLGVGLARYDDPEAERVLRLAAVTAPTLLPARLHYGAYLAREGLLDEALAELHAARELDVVDPRVPRELGVAQLLAGRADAAVEELERAVELDDADPDLRLLLGLALLQIGRTEEAATEIHRASLELLHEAHAQLLTALACGAQEWWDEAWDALARAEGAAVPVEASLLREAEEILEAGSRAAADFAREQLAPAMLRDRLMERI